MKLIFEDDGQERKVVEIYKDRIIISQEMLYEGDWVRFHDYGASLLKDELKTLFKNEGFKNWLND